MQSHVSAAPPPVSEAALADLRDRLNRVRRVELPEALTSGYAERRRSWQHAEGGYSHEHSTKPATLAVALGDSPSGLLAWIGEKLWSWTDHDDDISAVFTDDEALTWVSAYWFTGTIGTSFGPYALLVPPPNEKIDTAIPTVLSIFPADLVNAPRTFAERLFDVRAFHEHTSGGHFAAWEKPEQYVTDLKEAVGLARHTRGIIDPDALPKLGSSRAGGEGGGGGHRPSPNCGVDLDIGSTPQFGGSPTGVG